MTCVKVITVTFGYTIITCNEVIVDYLSDTAEQTMSVLSFRREA